MARSEADAIPRRSAARRLGGLAILLAASLCPAEIEGQVVSRLLGQQAAWDVVLDGPDLEVSGVVLTPTGTPLERALVGIEGVPEAGALTDPEGRFSLRVPGPGEWSIRIRWPGASEVAESIVVPHGASVRMIVMMRETAALCVLYLCEHHCRDLAIEVSDAETGAIPDGQVTVRLEHASGILTHTTRVDSTSPSHPTRFGLDREITTEGVHNIEIRAPGYHPWRLEGVWLELSDECHPRLMGGPAEARLERITQGGADR